jgi:hypothetical protein
MYDVEHKMTALDYRVLQVIYGRFKWHGGIYTKITASLVVLAHSHLRSMNHQHFGVTNDRELQRWGGL